MDYGKYKFELSKKDHQSRRHQKSTQVKEIKLRPVPISTISKSKIRQIKEFLADGNKTKVTLTYRGREMANQEMGRTMMTSVMERSWNREHRVCAANGRPKSDHDLGPQKLIVRKGAVCRN